jgi:hypothetical protein
MTREEMCVKFCERLPDGTLSSCIGNDFDALFLFQQRQLAFDHLALRGISVYDKHGRVSCGLDDPKTYAPSIGEWGGVPVPWGSGGLPMYHVKL